MHYVNVPVGMTVFDYNNSTCANDLCVINSVHNFTRTLLVATKMAQRMRLNIIYILRKGILKSMPPSYWNRTQTLVPSPLSYLVHFIGDIHQPLHISYAVDLGGNLFQVRPEMGFFFCGTKLTFVHSLCRSSLRML
jgi:hypothetical protein